MSMKDPNRRFDCPDCVASMIACDAHRPVKPHFRLHCTPTVEGRVMWVCLRIHPPPPGPAYSRPHHAGTARFAIEDARRLYTRMS